MGRINRAISGKCHLQKIQMCSCCGAYDTGRAYWGLGTPLYVAQDTEGNQFFTRANTRQQAKANVLKQNKSVTFYR